MIFRAIICCAALIFGLLAALGAAAESVGACSGAACNAAGKPQPLNLMSFMRGSAKAGPAGTAAAKTASTTKRRHATTKTAARARGDGIVAAAASSEPPVLPVAASTAYASQPAEDVQVVSGDDLNAIDLAMNSSAAETNGATYRTDSEARDRFKSADATPLSANQGKSDNAAAPLNEPAGNGAPRDDSWMTRFWSAIGDGFVALAGMVRQLFG
jgi:hypothetical protein